MKKKIAILGSTGTIGKKLIEIIKKDKKSFDIVLLSANENYKLLLKQSKLLNVKNIIITNNQKYLILKKKKIKGLNIFNDFKCFRKIFKTKIDYTMSAISGLSGLEPTLSIIKYSKTIAIANKESIICAWNLLKSKLSIYKTKFIPVDSEHFSIWFGLNDIHSLKIEKIYLTASGGPFLNYPKNKFKFITPKQALNHPNWNMGNKISIDSATMMNKVFELIEAKKIFNLDYKKIDILVHRSSYIHAIIKFSNGMIKIIAHDTNMKIPIFNSIYLNKNTLKTSDLNLQNLNNLVLKKVNYKKFPIDKILNIIPKKSSLFETILVQTNDLLVDLFLNKKINFNEINKYIFDIINLNEFKRYKKIEPKSLKDIMILSKKVRQKVTNIIKY